MRSYDRVITTSLIHHQDHAAEHRQAEAEQDEEGNNVVEGLSYKLDIERRCIKEAHPVEDLIPHEEDSQRCEGPCCIIKLISQFVVGIHSLNQEINVDHPVHGRSNQRK